MDTLGEWSDGDDDWVFDVQIPIEYQEADADDEIIRNIPEEMFRNIPEASDSDSEVEQSRRSRTRAISETSDSEVEEEVQTGQGEKRKNDSDDDDDDDEEREHSYYEITGTKKRRSKKFSTIIKDTEIRFNNTVENMDLIDSRNRTHAIIQQLVDDVTGGIKDRDQIHFVLRSAQLETPIALPFMPRAQFTPERVFAAVERVVQSNREFRLNDTVHVNVWHVEMTCPRVVGNQEKNVRSWMLRSIYATRTQL